MRITIDRVLYPADSIVLVETPYGSLIARWAEAPVPNEGDFNVEIEISEPLKWGEDCAKSQRKDPIMWVESESNHIVGSIESIDEGNLLSIRAGAGLFMVEIDELPPGEVSVGDGILVTADKDALVLYPYQL